VVRGVVICIEEDSKNDDERWRYWHAVSPYFFPHDYEAAFAQAGFITQEVFVEDLNEFRGTVYVLESPSIQNLKN
jgi:hypothetical protein